MLKITSSNSEHLPGAFYLTNNFQITIFDDVKLTKEGTMLLSYKGGSSLLQEELVKEATQLMIEHGIVITNEADKVGV